MGVQICPCHKKVIGYPRFIVRINLVDLDPLCYILIFSLKAFLVMERYMFKCVLLYMGMAAILLNVANTFEQIINTRSTKGPM